MVAKVGTYSDKLMTCTSASNLPQTRLHGPITLGEHFVFHTALVIVVVFLGLGVSDALTMHGIFQMRRQMFLCGEEAIACAAKDGTQQHDDAASSVSGS